MFLLVLMENKMSVTTRTVWQNYTVDDKDMPSFEKLLEFVDRRAKHQSVAAREVLIRANQQLPTNGSPPDLPMLLVLMGVTSVSLVNDKGTFCMHTRHSQN